MREWTLTYNARPWTCNAERNMHHYKRAALIKEWRQAAFLLCKEAKVPPLEAIEVDVIPYLVSKGRPQDIGAAYPSYKALQDGVVDAGVIPDDSPRYVKKVTFYAPVASKFNALVLVLREATEDKNLSNIGTIKAVR